MKPVETLNSLMFNEWTNGQCINKPLNRCYIDPSLFIAHCSLSVEASGGSD